MIGPKGGHCDRLTGSASLLREVYSVKVSRVIGHVVVKGYPTGESCQAGSVTGAAQGHEVSKNAEVMAEYTVRGLLRDAVMRVLDHVPVTKGNAAFPGVLREGCYE